MNAPVRQVDNIDRMLIVATQEGLPLVPRPFDELARRLGVSAEDVIARLSNMLDNGVVRRIGIVPNHYRLGFGANGMSVWDVDDKRVDELGEIVGALDYVSHCYRRPRRAPVWPYNLFAMVHGKTPQKVEEKVAAIAEILGAACRSHDVLYSTRILKKTGLRLDGKRESHV